MEQGLCYFSAVCVYLFPCIVHPGRDELKINCLFIYVRVHFCGRRSDGRTFIVVIKTSDSE